MIAVGCRAHGGDRCGDRGGRRGGRHRRGGSEQIAFWILAPLALLGAVGMVFSKVAVHSALWLVLTMLCLGCLYIAQDAEFLGFVQIIVYTGAIMMLFLFVLMLTGRDAGDSVFEVLRGQRRSRPPCSASASWPAGDRAAAGAGVGPVGRAGRGDGRPRRRSGRSPSCCSPTTCSRSS